MLHSPENQPGRLISFKFHNDRGGKKLAGFFFFQLHTSKEMRTTWTSSAGCWGVATLDDTIIFQRVNVCGVNNLSYLQAR